MKRLGERLAEERDAIAHEAARGAVQAERERQDRLRLVLRQAVLDAIERTAALMGSLEAIRESLDHGWFTAPAPGPVVGDVDVREDAGVGTPPSAQASGVHGSLLQPGDFGEGTDVELAAIMQGDGARD